MQGLFPTFRWLPHCREEHLLSLQEEHLKLYFELIFFFFWCCLRLRSHKHLAHSQSFCYCFMVTEQKLWVISGTGACRFMSLNALCYLQQAGSGPGSCAEHQAWKNPCKCGKCGLCVQNERISADMVKLFALVFVMRVDRYFPSQLFSLLERNTE